MWEICISGSTRGEWVARVASPSLLLYRRGRREWGQNFSDST